MDNELTLDSFYIGVSVGFALYCLFSLISFAIRELFKIMKI